ncbi:aldo/keto reductase [Corallincola luteus]|uniref:Aldo/keto reductase n=1 Tax=Corallincola luteus TaxID=1775177 RepID=A0ABY2AI94_9GAMM|nr:aldo/keto reductase [Corallincola luteus]TCI02164.1 aldo/keto reductase [Corallincola luteus]
MQQRKLGTEGLNVSTIGLGCMGMSEFYGGSERTQSFSVLNKAIDLGVTFWDTADMYGQGDNERLLGAFFKANPQTRAKVQLATKFGVVRADDGEFVGVNGRPDYIQASCDASLKRLGVDHIDLYYQHRVDPTVPIEETVGAMAELVQQGKVRYLGLSEASASTIRRAHAVHSISAVQSEYSLWSQDVEAEILPLCTELNIGFVPYSPLGRGFLTGAIKQRSDLAAGDWRLANPRFSEQNFALNLQLVTQLESLAAQHHCTSAQLALAWLLAQHPHIAPIPGTRSVVRLEQNATAESIVLSQADLDAIKGILNRFNVQGTRYPEQASALLFGDTPAQAATA